MAGINRKPFGIALTADGMADGTVTVDDTSRIWTGAKAWISSSGTASKLVEVAEVVDATRIKLKLCHQPGESFVGYAPNYGASSMAAFTVAQGARLDFPQQLQILGHDED